MSKLKAWKAEKSRNPLILNGARQVGKTYCLERFGRENFPKMHIVNFELDESAHAIFESDLKPDKIIEKLSFHLKTSISIKTDLILFDEVQACPRALTSLKYFSEQKSNIYLCACGSLLGLHLSPVSFPVGKVTELTLHPMTFTEFLMAQDDIKALDYLKNAPTNQKMPTVVHNYLWEQLRHYFIVGGLPEVVKIYIKNKTDLYKAFHKVREKQNTLIKNYFSDIAKHCGKINALHIQRTLSAIPTQLARTQDGNSRGFQFQGVIPGTSRYSRLAGPIDWLCGAGLVYKVHIIKNIELPLKAQTKENRFKLFLFDVGILGALSELAPETILNYDYKTYKGYFAENYVLQSFLAALLQSAYCWEQNQAEIEYIRELRGKIIPVEVKSGWKTKARSLASFIQRYSPESAVILSAQPLNLDGSTLNIPLYLSDNFDNFFL